jgi:hypothetical protein
MLLETVPSLVIEESVVGVGVGVRVVVGGIHPGHPGEVLGHGAI